MSLIRSAVITATSRGTIFVSVTAVPLPGSDVITKLSIRRRVPMMPTPMPVAEV